MKNINSDFMVALVPNFMSVSYIFLYCIFGNFTESSYEDMIDCLYISNWQELPIDLQKYFIILIQSAQQPLIYTGLGLINASRDTFAEVKCFRSDDFFDKMLN